LFINVLGLPGMRETGREELLWHFGQGRPQRRSVWFGGLSAVLERGYMSVSENEDPEWPT